MITTDNHDSMTSLLLKNETLDLFDHFETPLENLSVAVDWSSINIISRNLLGFKTKKITDRIDLGLTCVMFNSQNQMTDLVCSSKFNSWLIKNNFPLGKSVSKDQAFRHFDHESAMDSIYKQMISVDLQKISIEIDHVYFYLSFDLRKNKSPNFSGVDSLKLISLRGTSPKNIISEYNIPTQSSIKENEGILVLAKLYRENESWKFITQGNTISESEFVKLANDIH